MRKNTSKTKKGAASIYIVIFTTTLLGVIALSFVRIMLAESLRTTNYSLSQSAYNSALAGIEDAKIVLLRNQNCVNNGSYTSGTGKKSTDCDEYIKTFDSQKPAEEAAGDCDIVGAFLHSNNPNAVETVIQTSDDSSYHTDAIDQAYTCVKISTYTDDFLAVLKEDASTKIIPLRTDNQDTQNRINHIRIQWFDKENYETVWDGENEGLINGYRLMQNGGLKTNKTAYTAENKLFKGQFGGKAIVPPPLQVAYVQTAESFNVSDFYASANTSQTNRGTLLFRPSIEDVHGDNTKNDLSKDSDTHDALAYSANNSFNTPIDVHCASSPGVMGGDEWPSNYACTAEFYVPSPIGGGSRNMNTTFLVVSLPYSKPTTDIAVKMFNCDEAGEGGCELLKFANVQPMVDSTGRANDLFRRVESRIELADTSFPISNYALASTRDGDPGVQKNFYVTKSNCKYSSSWPSGDGKVKTYVRGDNNEIKEGYLFEKDDVRPQDEKTCYSASGANGENKIEKKQ